MTKKPGKIQFHYLEKSFYLPHRKKLKDFILKIFKKEEVKVQAVNFIFCSDKYLLKLNKAFLNHNTYTDVISFQYSNPAKPVVSDIYISIDRIKENSKLYRTPFIMELYRVIFHGTLHLCGYKDKTNQDSILMKSMEDHYLKKYVPREKRISFLTSFP